MKIQPIEEAVAATECAGAATCTAAPDESDAAKFTQLMGIDAPDAVAPAAAVALAPLSAPVSPGSPTLGDAILNGLRTASGDMNQTWDTVSRALQAPELRTSDVLKMQFTVLKLGVEYDWLSKVTDKASKTIDQVIKVQ